MVNHPLSARTGVRDVDVVLDALESHSPTEIEKVTKFSTQPCVTRESPSRHPLACPPGMRDGDPLTGLFLFDVEGGLLDPNQALELLSHGLSGRLYGVYLYGQEESRPEVPMREYGIVFLETSVPRYGFISVDVAMGLIVSIEAFRANPLMDDLDDPRWLLPPLEPASNSD